MVLVRFEPMTSALERAQTVHASDRAATVIDSSKLIQIIKLIIVKS
jgi:hypothetical protein